ADRLRKRLRPWIRRSRVGAPRTLGDACLRRRGFEADPRLLRLAAPKRRVPAPVRRPRRRRAGVLGAPRQGAARRRPLRARPGANPRRGRARHRTAENPLADLAPPNSPEPDQDRQPFHTLWRGYVARQTPATLAQLRRALAAL